MTGTSCKDDARVKVPSFQKVAFFLQYEIFHREPSICILVCLKMLLTAVIKDEKASYDLLQSDSSFLSLYMQFIQEVRIVLYALSSATWHSNFQRLFITTRRYCSSF